MINEEKIIFHLDKMTNSILDSAYNDIQKNIKNKRNFFELNYDVNSEANDFPVKKLNIIVEITPKQENLIMSGSYSENEEDVEKYEVEINIDIYNPNANKNDFMTELHETIIHELKHAHDFYIKSKKGLKNKISDVDRYINFYNDESFLDNDIKSWYDFFIKLFYYSSTDEFSPTTVEMLRSLNMENLEYLKNNSRGFSIIKKLTEFEAEKFYDILSKEINNKYPNKNADIIISKLINKFNKNIEKASNIYPEVNIKEYSKAFKKNNLDFFKYYQKRFNSVGEKLKRQIYKILALKTEK